MTVQEDQTSTEVDEVSAVDNVTDDTQQVSEEAEQEPSEKMVPLSALKKERDKRQELQANVDWQNQQLMQFQKPQEPVDDSYKYESATKEDLEKVQEKAIRAVEEKHWIRDNPEKYAEVNENLAEFLKQRPNYTSAIESAQNRYEEAYALMDAMTPKQKKQIQAPKKETRQAPNSPGGVPKSSAMNATVDVMAMNDAEFNEWRKSKRRSRR